MKLIYPVNARIPTEKAHGLQIMKMCEAFASLNKLSEIELIVPFRIGGLKKDPFEYYGIKKKFKITKIFCFDLFWIKILPKKFCFYLEYLSFAFFAAAFLFFARRSKENIFYSRDYVLLYFLSFWRRPVAEIHDYRSQRPRRWIKRAMARSKKIITNSPGTREYLQEHYEIPNNKFLVAPNGVDFDYFQIKETKSEARERLSLPLNPSIIGYIGRLETMGEEKGIPELIENFAVLAQKRGDVIFLIIGGPDHLVGEYRQKAAELGIDAKRIFFMGQTRYDLIPLYMRAIDVAVLPFPWIRKFNQTTSPIKVFEFMAAGKIIVGYDSPALKNYLNQTNAILYNPEIKNDLAFKLDFSLKNYESAKKLAQQALSDARRHTWASRAERIIDFINS
ncbi:MAG: glycosyltransferase family 4 protein [Candidatus Portnoybacteria bacterium]|nr:glycosyltransferase family 4 protein [Candidatus Portnoybacteria bacterium]